jgi:hypothetical protein
MERGLPKQPERRLYRAGPERSGAPLGGNSQIAGNSVPDAVHTGVQSLWTGLCAPPAR